MKRKCLLLTCCFILVFGSSMMVAQDNDSDFNSASEVDNYNEYNESDELESMEEFEEEELDESEDAEEVVEDESEDYLEK